MRFSRNPDKRHRREISVQLKSFAQLFATTCVFIIEIWPSMIIICYFAGLLLLAHAPFISFNFLSLRPQVLIMHNECALKFSEKQICIIITNAHWVDVLPLRGRCFFFTVPFQPYQGCWKSRGAAFCIMFHIVSAILCAYQRLNSQRSLGHFSLAGWATEMNNGKAYGTEPKRR